MNNQPFYNYKNYGVEYDLVLQASVKVGTISEEVVPSIVNLLTNEDFLAMFFPKLALGRVYGYCEYKNETLHFKFGISLVDASERPTSKELLENIKDFILSLNKNVEVTPKLDIEESDIKLDILAENKELIDNIDKKLVNESRITFNDGTHIQELILTSDGIVEKYENNVLCDTMPFSKLGVIRECKSIIADGYVLALNGLTEAEIKSNTMTFDNNDNQNNDNLLANPEQTKRDLEQNIKDVEEIQELQTELEDKLGMLNEDVDGEEYVVVIYTNIDGDFVPDVVLKDTSNTVADDIDSADKYDKETAEQIAQEFNNKNKSDDKQFIAKAVSVEQVYKLDGLYESDNSFKDREVLVEDTSDIEFPTTEFTAEVKTAKQIEELNLEQDLTIEQIAWLQHNIGDIKDIENAIQNLLKDIRRFDGAIISLDDYFNKLNTMLKGE